MLKQVLIVSSFVLFCTLLILYVFQRRLIYFPNQQTPALEEFQASDMTVVHLQTKDKLILRSWYKPAINNQPTLLFLHGNAGHIGYRMPLVRPFLDKGLGVFLLEYRGYGGNKGFPTEEGIYEDARTAVQFLHENKVQSERLVLYGESLGTGVATKIATEYPVCAVILQSPFTSLLSLAKYHYPWLIIKPWDQYNSLARLKEIHAPLLVLHGKLDQIVPFSEGVTIFNQANEPKKMLVFDDKHHNDLSDSPGFYEEIMQFIQKPCIRY